MNRKQNDPHRPQQINGEWNSGFFNAHRSNRLMAGIITGLRSERRTACSRGSYRVAAFG